MPPLEAIRAATVNAAELMGWEENIGAAEIGKYADLIAVEGDPLTDIAVLQQVKFRDEARTDRERYPDPLKIGFWACRSPNPEVSANVI